MSLPSHFISCDWGTSNFRLRLVETDTLEIILEIKTHDGVKLLFQRFCEQKDIDQKTFFVNYLKKQIRRLPTEYHETLIVSSGMSTSNIGLMELPYAELPFYKNGDTLIKKQISISKKQDLLLISGIKCETGMMRGEEVQAIGLEKYLSPYSRGLLLLPGTHSKHISYTNGQFYALKNYMTGELFDVLAKKSILSNSVESGNWNEATKAAFKEGLQLGLEGRLTSSLFIIRARNVIENRSKTSNYFMLSGLLIGDELSYLRDVDESIFLAAPDTIFELYKTALESLVDSDKVVLLNGPILESALLKGQKKVLLQHGA